MTTAIALALLLLFAAGFGLARRHHKLSDVPPELRHPLLYLPLSVRSDIGLRIGRRLFALAVSPVAEGVRVRTDHVPAAGGRPAVRVLVYERADRTRTSGALLWIHGGGLVMGMPEQDHDLCSRFAASLGIAVVSVDYRLAPDHPFPAGLEDCHAALAWLHAEAGALGVDPAKVAVGGGSAGGGLAACVAQMAHDRGGPALAFQLLQYPMLDDRTALRADLDALSWTQASNRYGWSAYLGHPVREAEPRPYASAARRAELAGLPPAWIGIGDIDLFHDEARDYAGRLRAAGVPCDLHVVPGMYHGAERIVPAAPPSRAFLDRMESALRTAIA
jgi:acetyl esterase/lipase